MYQLNVQTMKTLEIYKLGQRIESWVNWKIFLYDSLEISMLYEQWREIIRSYLIRECYLWTKNEALTSFSNTAMQVREISAMYIEEYVLYLHSKNIF